MSKVIVGISGNIKEMPALSGLEYDAAPRNFSDSIKEAGGLPIVIPVGHPHMAKDYIAMIDKLVLSGGQHVDPSFYGQEKEIDSDDYSLERDAFELALVKEALKQKKPIVAICRGMQLVNVALGGTLEQSITNHWQDEVTGTSHSLSVKPRSRVSQLFQEGVQINSLHHQCIKDLAPDLVATAFDPRDGTIEAIEHRVYPLLGLQWHPELLSKECVDNRRLFHYLVHQL
ncbi:gamma-glutamyl-gamma-aminobutyrate hydrolase family protein [Streptococcus cameli]